jgi:flagellar basal body-associated protein FliL
LAEFRQHIHARVTGSPQWKSRTLPDFLTYLNLVWKCIQSADFNLNFKTVVERATYDQMNLEIKVCERQLSEEYKVKFGLIEKEVLMCKAELQSTDDLSIEKHKLQLSSGVLLKVSELDQDMKEIFSKLGRDKWEVCFLDLWKSFKKEQENHWNGLLEKCINYQLKFDFWTDHLKKEMRRRIRDIFHDKNCGNLTNEQKDELFQELYGEILDRARDTQPIVNVEDRVNQVYRKKSTDPTA